MWIKKMIKKVLDIKDPDIKDPEEKKFPCKECVVLITGECRELCDKVEINSDLLKGLFEKHNCCPDCGSDSFYEGPSGGGAQNVSCAGCGHRFNLGLPLFIHRI